MTRFSKRWTLTAHRRRAQRPTVRLHILRASCSMYAFNPPCVRSLCCCCAFFCPFWGTIGSFRGVLPRQRQSSSNKYSVRCRSMKQRDKICRNFRSNPTFDKVHYFSYFFRILPQILHSHERSIYFGTKLCDAAALSWSYLIAHKV